MVFDYYLCKFRAVVGGISRKSEKKLQKYQKSHGEHENESINNVSGNLKPDENQITGSWPCFFSARQMTSVDGCSA